MVNFAFLAYSDRQKIVAAHNKYRQSVVPKARGMNTLVSVLYPYIQVNWLNTDVIYPNFGLTVQILGARSLPIHLHANFSAYYGQFNPHLA